MTLSTSLLQHTARVLSPIQKTLVGLCVLMGATGSSFAVENWQSYTYWATPTVIASKGFKKLVDDFEQASNAY